MGVLYEFCHTRQQGTYWEWGGSQDPWVRGSQDASRLL